MNCRGVFLILSVVVAFSVLVAGQTENLGPNIKGKRPYVTIFEHYFYGRRWDIKVAGSCRCRNYPEDALRLITSIHANGNCVVLYKDKGCYGDAVRMEDYSYGYRDLGLNQLNDVTSALRPCGCYEESEDDNVGTTERAYE